MIGLGLGCVLASLGVSAALSPITIQGNAFYNGSTDSRFYIRGVDYQPGGSSNITDPLSDDGNCVRDIKYFSELGINTIRVYSVDNSISHDNCMKALEEAGIYLILDVNTPKQSLNRYDEQTLQLSYNSGYLQHIFATIDSFKNYTNTLGFFAANEVINSENTTVAAPYIKAVVRDMKAYIKNQANRTIPVGYSAADIAMNRWEQMCYLNCGDKENERIDMFGMNDYQWCGTGSSYTISGWSQNVAQYGNYSIPLFMSEFGCNTVRPRTFPEISALYNTEMTGVYSGGLVYEFYNAANDYGLVQDDGDSVSLLPDFTNLKSQYASYPPPTGAAGAETTRSPAACPTYESGKWDVSTTGLPAMPSYASRFLTAGAGKGLGFNGPDTQNGSELDESSSASLSSAASSTASSSARSSSRQATTARSSSAASSSSASSSSKASSKSKNEALGVTIAIPAAVLAVFNYLI